MHAMTVNCLMQRHLIMMLTTNRIKDGVEVEVMSSKICIGELALASKTAKCVKRNCK